MTAETWLRKKAVACLKSISGKTTWLQALIISAVILMTAWVALRLTGKVVYPPAWTSIEEVNPATVLVIFWGYLSYAFFLVYTFWILTKRAARRILAVLKHNFDFTARAGEITGDIFLCLMMFTFTFISSGIIAPSEAIHWTLTLPTLVFMAADLASIFIPAILQILRERQNTTGDDRPKEA